MIQSMWFNLHVKDLKRSEQFYQSLGFEINHNPDMLDKMVGIKIGSTIVILIENKHFEAVTQDKVHANANETIISLGVKTNEEGGHILEQPTVKQGYYGAMFADPDGHKFNFLVC